MAAQGSSVLTRATETWASSARCKPTSVSHPPAALGQSVCPQGLVRNRCLAMLARHRWRDAPRNNAWDQKCLHTEVWVTTVVTRACLSTQWRREVDRVLLRDCRGHDKGHDGFQDEESMAQADARWPFQNSSHPEVITRIAVETLKSGHSVAAGGWQR